ncbi:MAG: hypothetical protein IKS44_00305, partial [Bacteroidales bacterium]|nr:hypothetical protein [Bacteroidales bacterium]
QIDLTRLFEGGFSTGHGILREPQDIQSYAALVCIAIQSNQNDQHGGQSIPNFDYALSAGVNKTYRRFYRQNLAKALELYSGSNVDMDELKKLQTEILDAGYNFTAGVSMSMYLNTRSMVCFTLSTVGMPYPVSYLGCMRWSGVLLSFTCWAIAKEAVAKATANVGRVLFVVMVI